MSKELRWILSRAEVYCYLNKLKKYRDKKKSNTITALQWLEYQNLIGRFRNAWGRMVELNPYNNA